MFAGCDHAAANQMGHMNGGCFDDDETKSLYWGDLGKSMITESKLVTFYNWVREYFGINVVPLDLEFHAVEYCETRFSGLLEDMDNEYRSLFKWIAEDKQMDVFIMY